MPWATLSWRSATDVLIWAIPFLVLLGVRPKKTPAILGTISFLGLVGIWIERYVLVVPSLSPHVVPFGLDRVADHAGIPRRVRAVRDSGTEPSRGGGQRW